MMRWAEASTILKRNNAFLDETNNQRYVAREINP